MKNYVSFEFSTLPMPLESKCACAIVTAVLKQLLSQKESKKEIRNVHSNKSRKNENSRLFEHKANSSTCILLIYHSNFSFTKNIDDFKTPWITGLCGCLRVIQLGSESLKAQHQVIATFALPQTFDHCVYSARHVLLLKLTKIYTGWIESILYFCSLLVIWNNCFSSVHHCEDHF